MTTHFIRLFVLTGFGLVAATGVARSENWPSWRGPGGDSVSHETGLPLTWSEKSNVLWKCPLAGEGASSPVVWGNAVFLTSQQGETLLLVKIDNLTGKVEWQREVGRGTGRRGKLAAKKDDARRQQKFHQLHNMASPSPVTDGETVIVHFGNGDLAAYDFQGNQRWFHNLQKEHGAYTIWWGHANSPVLYRDLVISVCMQDSLADLPGPPSPSYLVAHDKKTGAEKWKTMRMTEAKAEECDSYTTPIFAKNAERPEMIVMGGNQIDAYDPSTGRRLWHLPGIVGGRTITGPTIGPNFVYATQGMRGPLLAIPWKSAGSLTAKNVAWKQTQGTPDTCCPVLWKDLLFSVSDNGIAQCFDAQTGELKWKERLAGDYKASPLAADGKIYFVNLAGQATVVAAADRFENRATNKLDDETIASPAVSNGRLYVRGKKGLYAIGAR